PAARGTAAPTDAGAAARPGAVQRAARRLVVTRRAEVEALLGRDAGRGDRAAADQVRRRALGDHGAAGLGARRLGLTLLGRREVRVDIANRLSADALRAAESGVRSRAPARSRPAVRSRVASRARAGAAESAAAVRPGAARRAADRLVDARGAGVEALLGAD